MTNSMLPVWAREQTLRFGYYCQCSVFCDYSCVHIFLFEDLGTTTTKSIVDVSVGNVVTLFLYHLH